MHSSSLSRCALFALTSVLGAGCFVPVPEGPPSGYETTLYDCTNGFDDDNDRAVDCRDTDCIARGYCNQIIPIDFNLEPEDTAEKCSDRIDNDDDGRFDCGDPDCTVILELCCSLEFDDASCSNGVDDDGNGFIDCVDSGCSRNPFVTVCNSEKSCTDFLDDDGDRRRDCADSDCEFAAACVPGGEDSCEDGDDDGDGRADCEDRDCYRDPVCLGPENTLARCIDGNNNDGNVDAERDPLFDCSEPTCQMLAGDDAIIFSAYCANLSGPEDTLGRCMDGIDNDGNGFPDCIDFSCSRGGPDIIAYCATVLESNTENCTDGVDNDGNNFTDCKDRNCCARGQFNDNVCAMYIDETVAAYCAERTEASVTRCTDGIDNDFNGFTDCLEFSCCRDGVCIDPAVRAYCDSVGETTLARCTDGIDNDGNGFVDCSDFSCSQSMDESILIACAARTEATFARCTDGVDNDGNSFSDCEDFSCRDVLEAYVAPVPGDSPEPTGQQRSPCRESVGDGVEWQRFNCTDGVDNDLDGFTDCDDWDCNWNVATRDLCLFTGTTRPRVCG